MKDKIIGIPAVFDIDNVDTDMIIPKQFLKTITRIGLGKYLFFEQRYNPDGTPNPSFVLNKNPGNKTNILAVAKNFGCGSSREHAAWSIKDFGIRAIIAESFADIFYNNCFENSILPISLSRAEIECIQKASQQMQKVSIDLQNQTVTAPQDSFSFKIDPANKNKIINNLDSIGETLTKIEKIKDFEAKQTEENPIFNLT